MKKSNPLSENIRVVASQNGEVEQVNHYYPYGGLMGESINSDAQPYKYNGKELDRHSGLDWYDYGARWYNGVSWMTPDPLAEKYYDISPYVYCLGNPVKFIDPDGRKVVIWYKDTNGTYKSFELSGLNNQKTIKIPQNQFVKDFITAYQYNIKNGGGDNMKKAVTDSKYNFIIYDGTDTGLSVETIPLGTTTFGQNGKRYISIEKVRRDSILMLRYFESLAIPFY